MGFKVEANYVQSESYSSGVVIDQSITPGTIVDNNSALNITLTVSEGFSKHVDRVVGYDLEAAIKILENKGIRVTTEVLPEPTDKDVISQMQANVVVKQTHENEKITSSSVVVTLYYYDHVVILPPDNPVPPDDEPTPDEPSNAPDSEENTHE